MSNNDDTKVPDIAPKPSDEERAQILHQQTVAANPGLDVEVTIGPRYGDKSVHITTRKRDSGPLFVGVVLGLFVSGTVALIASAVVDGKKTKSTPIEVTED